VKAFKKASEFFSLNRRMINASVDCGVTLHQNLERGAVMVQVIPVGVQNKYPAYEFDRDIGEQHVDDQDPRSHREESTLTV
jgi:hypothetical protein